MERNCPHVTEIDSLSSLTVGNGGFAFTADVTGMQTWPELYRNGVPLGTMSHWGWHSFPNTEGYTLDDVLEEHDLGRGPELYACQTNRDAAEWVRSNPHRLHLGNIGFCGMSPDAVAGIDQTLDLWTGILHSDFTYCGHRVSVQTAVDPECDMVSFKVVSDTILPVALRFPYPTGAHTDDACSWAPGMNHSVDIVSRNSGETVIERIVDDTEYYVTVACPGATVQADGPCRILVCPEAVEWSMTVCFASDAPQSADCADSVMERSRGYWNGYWQNGGAVDFNRCSDPRAAELERRVVLSQYLTAVQCSAPTPPQETGLTYNSWYGKFHMEMVWWHEAHFALWGHADMLARTMPWYIQAQDQARSIAERQGHDGIRWMKMTDPSGTDTPSDIGTYLIWQQPHVIYLAELLRRAGYDVSDYSEIIDSTAQFMASFAVRDGDRYVLKGCIPAQETLKPETTVNPPFELSYWHFGLETAQLWRERRGLERNARWDSVLDGLSPLASRDGLYLAAESAPDTYSNPEMTADHMAMLGAFGILPENGLFDRETMSATLDKVLSDWNWQRTWGWDFPMTAMTATRLGRPDDAVAALLLDVPANTFLVNGHNWQNSSLRCYLPGNGGLLAAIAVMCAGYDGCSTATPGFPADWDVRWEGLLPLP